MLIGARTRRLDARNTSGDPKPSLGERRLIARELDLAVGLEAARPRPASAARHILLGLALGARRSSNLPVVSLPFARGMSFLG
jgi:hypothetical protein